jgi:hypothetical protein
VTLDDGPRYTTVPDGVTAELIIEVKATWYVYASRQLLVEIALAGSMRKTLSLVVQPQTRVSRQLQGLIAQAGGTVRVRVGDNTYRKYDENPGNAALYRADNGEWEKT